jgi:hypothetical protein
MHGSISCMVAAVKVAAIQPARQADGLLHVCMEGMQHRKTGQGQLIVRRAEPSFMKTHQLGSFCHPDLTVVVGPVFLLPADPTERLFYFCCSLLCLRFLLSSTLYLSVLCIIPRIICTCFNLRGLFFVLCVSQVRPFRVQKPVSGGEK